MSTEVRTGKKHHYQNHTHPAKQLIIVDYSRSGNTSYYLLRNTVCHGVGNGKPLQYSCLENLMDSGAWWAAVHGVAKSWTRMNS